MTRTLIPHEMTVEQLRGLERDLTPDEVDTLSPTQMYAYDLGRNERKRADERLTSQARRIMRVANVGLGADRHALMAAIEQDMLIKPGQRDAVLQRAIEIQAAEETKTRRLDPGSVHVNQALSHELPQRGRSKSQPALQPALQPEATLPKKEGSHDRETIRSWLRAARKKSPALKPGEAYDTARNTFDLTIGYSGFYGTYWQKSAPEASAPAQQPRRKPGAKPRAVVRRPKKAKAVAKRGGGKALVVRPEVTPAPARAETDFADRPFVQMYRGKDGCVRIVLEEEDSATLFRHLADILDKQRAA